MQRASHFILHRLLPAGAVLLAFAAPACLTIPGGASIKPEYPAEALQRKDGGTVKVQLEFRAPGDRPRVTVLERAESSELNHVVAHHVEQFRVPCMEASAGPVTLVQAYVFDPTGHRG